METEQKNDDVRDLLKKQLVLQRWMLGVLSITGLFVVGFILVALWLTISNGAF